MPREAGGKDAVRRELDLLPSADEWPDIDPLEHEHRAAVLADIACRVRKDGPHRAVPAADRGRQFLPFAALNGFDDFIAQVEGDADGRVN